MPAVPIDTIPFAQLVGMTLAYAEGGRSSCRVQLQPQLLNSNGVAHGGLSFTLADTCMGQAVRSTLEPGQGAVTVECKINYFRPGAGSELRSESEVVHRTRSLASVQCRILAGGELVATAHGTFAIRPKPVTPPGASA